jgi:hypothetical protein
MKIRHEDTKLWWEYFFVLQLIDNDKDDDYDDDKKSVAVRYRITFSCCCRKDFLCESKNCLKNKIDKLKRGAEKLVEWMKEKSFCWAEKLKGLKMI